ncbi:ribose 5-phosphate isomerase B [Mycoplasma flocculare]|uniref:Ribose 5-phosphate isomerase n=2 Tax=Mesomycoplasma flocculare TaxID=2128 RepID=A0A0A8E8X1_MESFC|nr:RpiB/LacA/LacB family sugar-phosphate isomerase [Mesomycoplasma flocculare]MXR39592.1 ribose 5-phosphate isomerase B [Mycoplasma sp. MF12]AJC50047.1 ribose 5-phosphate isomerase [Mesomycoplasma flocculare ATCC 27399]ENX51014.1 ribose 5-phosphate isomerase B [Mesomycoplasma flocculare ATCC 27716]MXR05926.1 ribose 5-phosphate isomerase B [Mesomycoplasma flocculare]MXR12395.1 ribose 5-phosphate isomerase B [Mesomycoplasma flocculare]
MPKKFAIASDHAGFKRKQEIIEYLKNQGFEVNDLGTKNESSVSYAVFGKKLANFLLENPEQVGIAICGTGLGMSYALNRFKKIRAARVTSENDACLAKLHNNANAIVLSSRFNSKDESISFIQKFLETEYEGGRHQERIDELDK